MSRVTKNIKLFLFMIIITTSYILKTKEQNDEDDEDEGDSLTAFLHKNADKDERFTGDGDLFCRYQYIYYNNLIEFNKHVKDFNYDDSPYDVHLTRDPHILKGKECINTFGDEFKSFSDQIELEVLRFYSQHDNEGEYSSQLYLNALKKISSHLNETAIEYLKKRCIVGFPPMEAPVYECKNVEGTDDFTCQCNKRNKARNEGFSHPHLYEEDSSGQCVGLIGSLCSKEANVNCEKGLECINGVCGGKRGYYARTFSGLKVRHSDEEKVKIAKKYKTSSYGDIDDFEYELNVKSGAPKIGVTCYFSIWNRANTNPIHTEELDEKLNVSTHDYISVYNPKVMRPLIYHIRALNTSDFDKYNHGQRFYHNLYFLAVVLLDQFENQLIIGSAYKRGKIPQYNDLDPIFKKLIDEYDATEPCLDEFPRMTCKKVKGLPDTLGQCLCTNDSLTPFLRYVEEDGQCVGLRGSICTTVRGNGNFYCKSGLKCESIRAPRNYVPLPTAFTNWEIKICGGRSALKDVVEEIKKMEKEKAKKNSSLRRIQCQNIKLHLLIIMINLLAYYI